VSSNYFKLREKYPLAENSTPNSLSHVSAPGKKLLPHFQQQRRVSKIPPAISNLQFQI
jgi:hypothetical protein